MADKSPPASSNPLENILNRIKPDTMSGRAMKYPYTLTAKVAQFPYRYYWRNNWLFRYYAFGLLATYPIFMWISKQVNSPANVELWEKKRASEH